MNETQEQILYFRNLEKTYAERLKQSANKHFKELTTISRDMFRAGKEALQEKAERDNPPPLTLEQLNQRVGKPVWCSRNKQYGIISKAEDEFQIWFCDGWEALEVFISKPIYDHEPKEINTK